MRVGTETADGSATDWLEFSLDDVIAVAPAPRPVSPQRVSRRRHPIEVEAGPYRVSGTVHLPIGADPRRYVATTGRRWLPLTDCTVSAAADEWAVEVVIVNLDHASRRQASNVPELRLNMRDSWTSPLRTARDGLAASPLALQVISLVISNRHALGARGLGFRSTSSVFWSGRWPIQAPASGSGWCSAIAALRLLRSCAVTMHTLCRPAGICSACAVALILHWDGSDSRANSP